MLPGVIDKDLKRIAGEISRCDEALARAASPRARIQSRTRP
jgi:hypothetical protein